MYSRSRIEDFIVSLVITSLIFVVPFWAEYQHTGDIPQKTMNLVCAMFYFSIGTNSRNLLIFVLSIAFSILMFVTVRYDVQDSSLPLWDSFAFRTILILFIVNGFDRWKRHIREGEPFFSFISKR